MNTWDVVSQSVTGAVTRDVPVAFQEIILKRAVDIAEALYSVRQPQPAPGPHEHLSPCRNDGRGIPSVDNWP